MTLITILLQAATGAEAGPMGQYSSLIMMVALIAIFYFFMIRPQSKKQKEVQTFRNSLAKGSKVVTAGGIYGKIREVKDNVVVLEISDNVTINIDKASIYASAADSPAQQAK